MKAISYLIKTSAIVVVVFAALNTVQAQNPGQPSPQNPPAGPAAARRGSGGIYPNYVKDDSVGFVPIFDGKTLKGWDGDPTFWRVENGEIIGETTTEKVVKLNNFLIWRVGKVKDFEVKFDYKMNGTNSGFQYRSTEMPELGKWILKGYQADFEHSNGYTGNVHEERGRQGHVVLSKRGEVTRAITGPNGLEYKIIGHIGESNALKGAVKADDWNTYHIIARGPVMMQFINGQLMSIAIDEDQKNFVAKGLLGFQMHSGPPFKVQFKNILYKKL